MKRMMGQRLWLGADHLLVITSQFLTERYKRFYFPDIQALTITRTSTGVVFNAVFAVVAALFAVWAGAAYLALEWDLVPVSILSGISVLFLLLLGLNALLGPTCNCYLYTAVHFEEIYCLGRLRRARRVLGLLRTVIEPVQGSSLTDVQVDELIRVQGDLTSPGTTASAPIAEAKPGQRPLRQENGGIHSALFTMLVVDAVVSAIALIQPQFVPMPVLLLLLVAVIGLTVGALIRQNNSTLPRHLRNVTWATFMYVCLLVVFVWVFMVIGQFQAELTPDDTPPGLEAMQSRLSEIMRVVAIVFDVLLSAFGFRILWEYRSRTQKPVAGPAPSPSTVPEQE
jgi:hypothetical protein